MHVILEGRAQARDHEQSRRAWLAWQIAHLPRLKKLPPLQRYMQVRRPRQRPQTVDQMKEIARLWVAAGDGEGRTQH